MIMPINYSTVNQSSSPAALLFVCVYRYLVPVDIDGMILNHSSGEQNNPMDFQGAWWYSRLRAEILIEVYSVIPLFVFPFSIA